MNFKGEKTKADMVKWLLDFQTEVSKLCRTDILQFTVEIWLDEDYK